METLINFLFLIWVYAKSLSPTHRHQMIGILTQLSHVHASAGVCEPEQSTEAGPQHQAPTCLMKFAN